MHCVLQCMLQRVVVRERGRDHHHYHDLTLQQFIAVCYSVVLHVAMCCLQLLHHVTCAVAADTRPPDSHCPTPPCPYLDDIAMPLGGCLVEAAEAAVLDEHE